MNSIVIEWPAKFDLASHVVIAHVDISSTGIRALMLFRSIIQDGKAKFSSWRGHIRNDCGSEIQPAWKDSQLSDGCGATLEICTFYNNSGVPVLSFLIVNAMLPPSIITSVAGNIIETICNRQILQVSIVAALHFTSARSGSGDLVYPIQYKDGKQNPHSLSASECAWNTHQRIEDGFLAATLQFLKVEHNLLVECIFVQGHKLKREICLDLPSSVADSTEVQVELLLKALIRRAHQSLSQIATEDGRPRFATEKDWEVRGNKGQIKPARALTEGDFGLVQPDSAAALYK